MFVLVWVFLIYHAIHDNEAMSRSCGEYLNNHMISLIPQFKKMEDDRSGRSRSFTGTNSHSPSEYSVDSKFSTVSNGSMMSLASTIRGQQTFEPRERFTLYKVEVNNGQKTWIVYRRYSDFVLLNKKLRRLFPGFLLNLPPKRLFRNNFDRLFLHRRQKGLEDFMRHLFSLPDVMQAGPVRKFFRLDNPPGPDEDLEASKDYCANLETSITNLKKDLQEQDYELARLRGEVTNLHLNGGSLVSKSQAEPSYTEQVLQQKLMAAEHSSQLARDELERMKNEIVAEKALELSNRQTEKQKRELQLRDLMKEFSSLQLEQNEAVKGMAAAFSNLGAVSINFYGKAIDFGKPEGATEKEEELKRSLEKARRVMEDLHKEHLEIYRKENEDLKSDCIRCEYQLQTAKTDNQTLRDTLAQLHVCKDEEIKNREKVIYHYQNELASIKRYVESTEEKYFYSLVLGVKLNMALKGRDTSAVNLMRPHVLFAKIRDQGIAIENWPSWVSRELASLASTTSHS